MNSGYPDPINTNKRPLDAVGSYPEANAGASKRIRTAQTPSKVVHVRNLPPDCSESDLLAIASPFGQVSNILMLKGKNQALLQMQDTFCATSLVEHYSTSQPFIRGSTVYFQYSDRGEISTPQSNESPNTILLVNVTNMMYQVTIDVLHQVFSKYGAIVKIVIFSKSGSFQSLIQFADLTSAIAAKNALDGQHIYVGCCTLRIQFSKFKHLDVKFNNDKSRDYTNPSLPSGGAPGTSQTGTGAAGQMSGLSPLQLTQLASLTGIGGVIDPSMGYLPGYSSAQTATPTAASQLTTNPYLQYGINSAGMMQGGTCVIIVSGLNPERVNPDVLFVLFGVYGDVNRVKILFNKKDTALIQMASSQQADLAISHLNGVTLYGNVLHVNISKHQSINVSRDPSKVEEAQLTKDYTGSQQHRYQKAGSKNFQHICPPSPTLHLSNIAPSLTEDGLRSLFSAFGTVRAFKYFPNDTKMALVQMASVTEAIEALIALHNYRADETAPNLRVSFAKTQIKDAAAPF